jgi:hypothetical protein
MNSGSAMNFNMPAGVTTTTVNTGSEVISSSSWNEIASRAYGVEFGSLAAAA